MKEIVIISGKGGTGKTSVSASFAVLGGKDVIVADCDVDAADMHLLLKPDYEISEEFYSGELAIIKQEDCIKCGKCKDVCRFGAINIIENKYITDPLSCEGCGYCARVCPTETIINIDLNVGNWYISNIRTGSKMVHAKLATGADNSGKLVAQVKNKAKELAEKMNKKYIVVDGSPGVGCPVVSSLSGASYVVLVTEPTVSGLHDLKRVYELVKKFNLRAGCIINKYDLNISVTREIEKFSEKEQIDKLAKIPYDKSFTEAVIQKLTVAETDNKIKPLLQKTWENIKNKINETN
ncbi:MAG: 4Fe-4S dicluster domain-containing protein [Chlorobi bacterium]|nr:4Fe-4S dicluster domain-containing protein [Chlorobiota bacterium]